MSGLLGGCRCGAVRYVLTLDQLPRTYTCHCLDCQTWSGSAFSQQTFAPESALSVAGSLVIYEFVTPSGKVSVQRMCGTCHTRIFNSNSARPGVVVVRAGTLDRSRELEAVAHVWVKRKQPWVQLPEDAPNWPEGAPPAELMQALASAGGR